MTDDEKTVIALLEEQARNLAAEAQALRQMWEQKSHPENEDDAPVFSDGEPVFAHDPSTISYDPLEAHPFSIPVGLDPQDWADNLVQQLVSYGSEELDETEKRMIVEALDAYRDALATDFKGRAMVHISNVSFNLPPNTDPLAVAIAVREQLVNRLRDL